MARETRREAHTAEGQCADRPLLPLRRMHHGILYSEHSSNGPKQRTEIAEMS